jgi:tRNA isopentenyl-2-thiomethyl-A-37 hydroxylase MiaE
MNPEEVAYFAQTDARNQRVPFGIKIKDRTRHMYVIGKTGMGKSTLLENLAVHDIQTGAGMAFLDPHGKTADLLLEYVPPERIKDVVYFAPFDTEFPISFNVMEDVGPDKRHLVANGLMSAFKKIWVDAWSARMEYILSNIILALLEYPDSTLTGVNRMLADKDYRNKVVANISDPSVKSFWVDEFAKYGERYMQEAGAAIQNKIGQFVANPLVRNIIGQPKSTFDIRKIMDDRKILIINLSKGRVGETNANLLGSMLITKIYLAAMSRADATERQLAALPQFYLFVDEFQSFANESFADILSEARKYKLNLTIAHQYIEQMSEEVRAAVFGNVGTMITFRVGAYDAEVLEKEFAPVFTAEDLVNLGFVQIYLKLMIDGVSSPPFSATTLPPVKKQELNYKDDIIESSRRQFARAKAEVEADIHEWHKPISAGNTGGAGGPKRDGGKIDAASFGRQFNGDRSQEPRRQDAPRPADVQKRDAPRDMPRNSTPPQPPQPAALRVEKDVVAAPQPQQAAPVVTITPMVAQQAERAASQQPAEGRGGSGGAGGQKKDFGPKDVSNKAQQPVAASANPPVQQKNPFQALSVNPEGKIEVKQDQNSQASTEPKPVISLSHLAAKSEKSRDSKNPTPENVSSLKAALASIVEKAKIDKAPQQSESKPQPKPAPTPVATPENQPEKKQQPQAQPEKEKETRNSSSHTHSHSHAQQHSHKKEEEPSKQTQQSSKKDDIKEVPADVLKQIFEM